MTMRKEPEPLTYTEQLAKRKLEVDDNYKFGKEIMKAVFWVAIGILTGFGLSLIAA